MTPRPSKTFPVLRDWIQPGFLNLTKGCRSCQSQKRYLELASGHSNALQAEGNEIIKEALQNLKDPSADSAGTAKATHAHTSKWLVVALAFSVVLITVWVAMPRKFSGTAASVDATDGTHSGQPNQEAAGMTSSQPSASTA